MGDTAKTANTITDKNGSFEFQQLPLGFFRLTVSAMGFATLNMDSFYLRKKGYYFNLGDLKIKENGIGIDLGKNGEKLFGMYKTFNNNPDSKGIGLFITKNQIDAMGGRIQTESELNKGTTFTIYFKWKIK